MSHKKVGFGEVSGIAMVPKTYDIAEIFRKAPTLFAALDMIQGNGVECKIGKGFASFQFFGLSGSSGAQELAKASYFASAVNAARPPHMFEQIASVRGAVVSVDTHLLRKMRETLHAQYILNDSQAQKSLSVAQTLQALDALDAMIEERHMRAAPIQDGGSEKPQRRKFSDAAHY